MRKNVVIALSILIIVILVGTSFAAVQRNNRQVNDMSNQIDSLQTRINQGFNIEQNQLGEDQQEALNEKRQNLLEARKEVVDKQLQADIISEEEADYMLDHLDLMDRHNQDYDPMALNMNSMDGMMGRGQRMERESTGHGPNMEKEWDESESELDEEQKNVIEEGKEKIWNARKELIEKQREVGAITDEEADYWLDHLELMSKHHEDYDPPAWSINMMDMMERYRR